MNQFDGIPLDICIMKQAMGHAILKQNGHYGTLPQSSIMCFNTVFVIACYDLLSNGACGTKATGTCGVAECPVDVGLERRAV